MALVKMSTLLRRARENGTGCGSFSVYSMEALMGTVKAAEELRTPVILQLAEARFKTAPLELMGPMMINAAKESGVDMAVHLDHGRSKEVIRKALEMGFTSVMYDGSSLPFKNNITDSRMVKAMAEAYDADVEAELGLVGRSEGGDHDYGIQCTVPEDAKIFMEQTGVDALAVAIGNQHGNYPSAPKLRLDILKDIHQIIPDVHLVLHGGSGITDADFQECIRNGITKVNIATAILNGMMDQASRYFARAKPHTYYEANREMTVGAYEVVKHHIEIFNLKEYLG